MEGEETYRGQNKDKKSKGGHISAKTDEGVMLWSGERLPIFHFRATPPFLKKRWCVCAQAAGVTRTSTPATPRAEVRSRAVPRRSGFFGAA